MIVAYYMFKFWATLCQIIKIGFLLLTSIIHSYGEIGLTIHHIKRV